MELADYTVTCLRALKRAYPSIEIHTVAYPVNDEAPFNFDFSEIGNLYNRSKFDHEKIQLFSDKLRPDLIICSGWTDRSYLKVIRTWKKKATTVLCMDNKWHGNIKQRIACFGAKLYLPRIFDFIWVPYSNHAMFAKKMGFKSNRIKLGFYSTDTSFYNDIYLEQKEAKSQNFPKVMICVARYIKAKNLNLLWDAFIEAQNEVSEKWELWNLGQGELFEQRVKHPSIRHHGFVQPEQMKDYIKKAGVFVLTSMSEPWGVVVHQFAAAGFPMILSKNVGAHEAFLKDGENGFLFDPENKEQLISSLIRMMNIEDKDLNRMGAQSFELAKKITTDSWVNTAIELAKNKNAV
jgi:glycosyltransferase involved in cell wall biosynthesis